MTTKIKILAGFTLMILIMAVMAVINFRGSKQSADGFETYRLLARADVGLSDTLTALETLSTDIFKFIDTEDAKHTADARQALAKAENELKEARENLVRPEQKNKISEILTTVENLKGTIDSVEKNLLDFAQVYTTLVMPGETATLASLSKLTALAQSVDNKAAIVEITRILEKFTGASAALGRYTASRSEGDNKVIRNNLALMQQHFDQLGKDLQTAEGRRLHNDLEKGFATLNTAVNAMSQQAVSAQQSLTDMDNRLTLALKTIADLNAEVTGERRQVGDGILVANAENSRNTLLFTIGGLIVGLGLAAFIVFGIVRVLKELSVFAQSVAAGRFDHQIKIREKGEVGAVVKAVQEIPQVLRNIMQHADRLAGDILMGKLRNRLDVSALPGAYGDLGSSVNTVSNAFTGVIDSLPVPVMACDKKFAIVFLNTIAQTVLGGNHISGRCGDQFKSESCSGEACLGKRAMDRNSTVTDEATVYPQGKKMEISVTAIPLQDMQGNVAGFFEIVTDLTEIKGKQATMLRVANEASEIANRVAAASEQLSSQVEQISRGAEVQRSRVESTASAMTEMNATVLEVARSAGQASEQSEKTREKASDGAGLVNQVMQSINQVNSVAITLQSNMQELGTQAESIGGLMNVISDIADQTNLLALNAAIEAARAGEAGRGFAVVADEVRKLAESTMSATHEVGSSIKAIQQSARINIDEVGTAVKSIAEATELANSSGDALGVIVELASASSQVVASIATAAEQQSATSEEINRAIDEINSVVSETSEGMIQSSAAVQDLSRMAQELNRTMDSLK